MVESFSKIKNGLGGMVRLARALPAFFCDRITLARAEEEIKKGVERRGETFLELARTRIYADPASPYLRLLKLAGCEFADLRSRVLADGLEAALARLAAAGVYLTADEYRGKTPVIRGGESFRVSPADLKGSGSAPGFGVESGGTTGRPVRAIVSLDWQAQVALARAPFFSAHGLFSYAHATYDGILPASGGINNLLQQARLGIASDRWYVRDLPKGSRLETVHHVLATYLIVFMAKRYGPGFPAPEYVPIDDLRRIVDWVAEERARSRNCCIKTAGSNAVRIVRTAAGMGISLDGTKFIVSGEPFTEAKREAIARAGAQAVPIYSFTEAGLVGYGCANPFCSDDVHINQNLETAVLHPAPLDAAKAAVQPLLFTTVHPRANLMLLNLANGDYGVLEERACGCALEAAGLRLHLGRIRSYEKLTSEGMNYFYGDLHDFFEQSLPREFGGGPGDYQLVEEEDEHGITRLTLRVHPQAGEIDPHRLLTRLREELGRGSPGKTFQASIWDGARTLRI
ncbi:MAG TPA: hypothetical protein VGA73_07140, partial [Candidatus Binatia bacterium]